jgi:hypothetical protein
VTAGRRLSISVTFGLCQRFKAACRRISDLRAFASRFSAFTRLPMAPISRAFSGVKSHGALRRLAMVSIGEHEHSAECVVNWTQPWTQTP